MSDEPDDSTIDFFFDLFGWSDDLREGVKAERDRQGEEVE